MSLYSALKFIVGHPLNRERRVGALLGFVRWQLGSRVVPGAVVYDWINGSRFFVRPGETGLTGNIYTGIHEFADMGFLLHFLRGGDTFVDVGANVGSYTILAGAVVGARTVAFEPVPSTYERLVANVRLNRLEEKVVLLNKGVGAAESGSIAFSTGSDTTNHVLAPDEQNASAVNVDITTLDCALRDESPTLMKVDVEGYEVAVLEGAKQTLAKQSLCSVIVELNGSGERYGYNDSRALSMLGDCGFFAYSYDPLSRSLFRLTGKNLRSGNTLFVRERSLVQERVRSAPKVRVNGREF